MKKILSAVIVAILTALTAVSAMADEEVYTLRQATSNCLVETIGGLTTASISKAKADKLEREEEGEYIVIKEFDSLYDNTAVLTTNGEGIVSVQLDVDDPWDSVQRASGQRDRSVVKSFFKDGFLRSSKVRHGHTYEDAELGEYKKLWVKVFWRYEEENFRLVIVEDGNPVEYSKAKATKTTVTYDSPIGGGTPPIAPLPEVDKSNVTYVKEYTGSVTFGGVGPGFAPQQDGSEMTSGSSSGASTTTNFNFGGVNYSFAPQVGGN